MEVSESGKIILKLEDSSDGIVVDKNNLQFIRLNFFNNINNEKGEIEFLFKMNKRISCFFVKKEDRINWNSFLNLLFDLQDVKFLEYDRSHNRLIRISENEEDWQSENTNDFVKHTYKKGDCFYITSSKGEIFTKRDSWEIVKKYILE